jgi:hypothetical protein
MSHRPVAFAAVLVALAAAAPRPASAHDRAPAPGFAVSVALPPLPPPWVAAVLPPPRAWGGHSLAVHYRWLDANRAAYLARWGWNPWRVARYDAWYGAYRAGLDARYAPPGPVAWARRDGKGRGHGFGNGWGRGHDD